MMMISANMPGTYDYGEVARSVLIAIVASYSALELAGRVTAAKGGVRLAWLGAGATALGIGMWAMHFKGMLALRLPVSVQYHWPTILASLLVAIFASAVALYVASRGKMGLGDALGGSVIMGGAIAGMHYIGMAAMRLPAIFRFSPFLVTFSVLLAVLFSLLALLMAFDLREETRWSVPRRLGAATVMGLAVSAMHYTGMAAARFTPGPRPDFSQAVSISPLFNNGVVIVTLVVLVAAIMTSAVDRRGSAKVQRLNRDLEHRVAERTLQLEAVNQALRMEIAERNRAEKAVRESEDRLRLVIDTIPQQIWSGPADGSLDFCNAQWRAYMGLKQQELQGQGWQRMLHPEDRERVLTAWRESVASGKPYEQEERHRGADGQYRWFLTRGVPLRDSEGRIVRWYGTNTDIEDRREAEGRLLKAFDEIKALRDELYKENLLLKEEVQASMFEEIIGSSPALRSVLVHVEKVAPTDSTVLITGETGTGKELVARAIHKRSSRTTQSFVSVNCAAIQTSLIASELFGYEKGAFTGATERRLGRFELADGGTIFLDEVGDLPPETQIALLRVLQERTFERVGGSQPIPVDVRVLAATNRDLHAAVVAGTFRQDLFYRLNVFPIHVPPLRDRIEDIPMLVDYFAQRYAKKAGKKITSIRRKTLELLQAYDWPGNIRELQNVIERAVILCDGDTLAVDETWLRHESPKPSVVTRGLGRLDENQEREIIESALMETRGRVWGPGGASEKLGIPRSTLESRIRSLRIDKKRFRSG